MNGKQRPVLVRGLWIGSGRPKICVPLVAENGAELKKALERTEGCPYDLVEFRADYYADIEETATLREALGLIREKVGEKPVLFTFRTALEGGVRTLAEADYAALLETAAKSGQADLVDVELFTVPEGLVEKLQAAGARVIGSSHDFEKTPAVEEMVSRLCRMQEMGMDITKLAVMPRSRQDVLQLLKAAVLMRERYGDRPCVTMSMGELGSISRIAGSFCGSAITFGTAGRASAPGQLTAQALQGILNVLAGEEEGGTD